MRFESITLTPDAADDNGVCLSQTPLAAGNLTITGALASGGVAMMDVARRVLVTCAGADSGRTFTLYGTSRDGHPQSEAVAGSAGSTSESTKDFITVTRVAVDDATADAVIVGTSGRLSSKWLTLDHKQCPIEVGFAVDISGTINFDVEYTVGKTADADIAGMSVAPVAFNHASVAAATADAYGSIVTPVSGIRLTINSFTATASATLHAIQAGAPRG